MARDPSAQYDEYYPGPPFRIRDGDNLFYVHPHTRERFISVTSALDKVAKEDLDHRWRPELTAKAAMDRLPQLVAATLTPDCGHTNSRCTRSNTRQHDWRETCVDCPCQRCVPCLIKDLAKEHYRESARATTRGSAFHHWVEEWVLSGGHVGATWDVFRAKCGRPTENAVNELVTQIHPYTESFLSFVDDFGLSVESWLMSEATVINREHMWGGTLDARIQFSHKGSPSALRLCEMIGHPNPVLSFDTKTREANNATFWPDNAMQLAAYRRGETVLLSDGTEEPLTPDDGALIVQVRPDGYGWRIPVTDDRTYGAFLGVLKQAWWQADGYANESTLVRAHPPQQLPGISTEPKRRAPRKVATAAIDPDSPTSPAKRAAPRKTAKPAPEPLAPPLPLQTVAAVQSAILKSMTRDSTTPYTDDIPF